MRNPLALTGRRILVTGASSDSDIGRALCLTLADLGARLVLVGRRREPLEETRALLPSPDDHIVAAVDLADLDAIPGWMARLADDGGPFSGLVHAASVQGYSPLRRIDRAQVDRYFTLNVGSGLMLARGLQRKGVAAVPAAIVFVGSVAGLTGQKGRALYAASKAALASATQTLALELADREIRVNGVAPGIVAGRRAEQQFALLTAEQNAGLKAAHPLGFGQPQDVADAAAFLLSDASRWITGVMLPLDGGYLAG
ncbi:SDR family oxidoreductase [Azospirillum sp.]|uniref:SDR family NAD(P)-dependent oxidoreductase n=1 Tax=Azospirillum sp. TaxID=34012 RepID=UPI002D435FFB|nr:SDR family oxidoreductase [Azospirillum sp.]HYD64583.1 SDR family oxidoreductase [Azospirillum sp.]